MEPSIFFSEVNERQGVFHRRTFMIGGGAALGAAVLVGRLAQLQLIDAQKYASLSSNNQFKFRLVPPPRGRILDRNGVEIASNRPDFRILVRKDELEDPEAALDAIGQLIPITPERRAQLLKEIDNTPSAVPISVANDLTWNEFARVNVRAPELNGVSADMGEARVYPFGGAFAHVIGYVAKVSQSDLDLAKKHSRNGQVDPLLLHPGFRIGKQGVEKALDLELRGSPGGQKIEEDSVGRIVRADPAGDIKATPGKEVVLTLDADIQSRALEAFGAESGAAVMMDVHTGDLLCLLSAPSFDANRFVSGVSGPEYRALADYERNPLLDKALSGLFPPGSTFKTMTALAALEAGVDPKATCLCTGQWYFGNRYFHCWKKGGHGTVNMHEAIKTSCDVYFYQTALKIGPDKLAEVAKAFGLGQTFDIGISGQKAGTVPSTAWKKKLFAKDPRNQIWFPGETPSYGIGQGYLQVNALQLCVMTARLANNRNKALLPRLIKSVGGVERPRGDAFGDLPFDPNHIAFVREAMASVANDVGGTAYRESQLNLGPEIKMAGKTGSAQVRGYGSAANRETKGLAWKFRDHGLFVAFAPYDDPRYAISVIVEHGVHGATLAVPIAAQMAKIALLKDADLRRRIEQPLDGKAQTDANTGQPAGEIDAPDETLAPPTDQPPPPPPNRPMPGRRP
jgi:penicillin-binding protein 2